MNDIDEHTADGSTLAADLLDVLRHKLERPELDYAEPPISLGGGFWADILAIRLTGAPPELDRPLVARVMPDPLLGRRETVVQREVAAQGFPAPIVRLAGDADEGLGRPYMVMDRAGGAPLLSGLTAANAVVSVPRLVRRLPRLLASSALQLHLLDPEPIRRALQREVPDASIDAADMVATLAAVADQLANPLLIAATTWLAAHRAEPARVSICHGDLHPFNVLVDADGSFTLVDWTASRISEPEFDLAFTMLVIRGAPLALPPRLKPAIGKAGEWLADRVLARYRALAAPHDITIDDDRLRWHLALQRTRVLTEVESWAPGSRAGHPFNGMADDVRAQLTALVDR